MKFQSYIARSINLHDVYLRFRSSCFCRVLVERITGVTVAVNLRSKAAASAAAIADSAAAAEPGRDADGRTAVALASTYRLHRSSIEGAAVRRQR